MLTCYVVDDEFHAVELLKDYIIKTPNIELVGFNQNSLTALMEINEKAPDIAFVDIDMPLLSGLEYSNLVKKEVSIIFTTAHADYAVDAFNQNAYDFLLKPIKYERFLQTIQKVITGRLHDPAQSAARGGPVKDNHIFVHCGLKGQMIRIELNDIFYIESLNNYLIFYLKDEKHIVYITLKEMLQTLPPDSFSRIHKSVIINDNRIKAIEGNQVVLNEKIKLTIGQSYKDAFLAKIAKTLIKRH